MNVATQVVAITAIALLAARFNFQLVGPPLRDVPCDPAQLKPGEICLADVMSRWQGNVLWIDARPRAEWMADGVPGSILWNLDSKEDANAFEAEAMNHLLEGKPVIVYCSEGNCGVSSEVAAKVRKLELAPEVHALFGGSGALKAAGMLKGPGPLKDSNSKP